MTQQRRGEERRQKQEQSRAVQKGVAGARVFGQRPLGLQVVVDTALFSPPQLCRSSAAFAHGSAVAILDSWRVQIS